MTKLYTVGTLRSSFHHTKKYERLLARGKCSFQWNSKEHICTCRKFARHNDRHLCECGRTTIRVNNESQSNEENSRKVS